MAAKQLIKDYMTLAVQTIGADQSLQQAKDLMKKLKFRHLPVLDKGNLVGVLSERDIKIIEGLAANLAETKVSEAYSSEPHLVKPDMTLIEVCNLMISNKFGFVLVVNDDKKLIGIFTWIDGLKALLKK